MTKNMICIECPKGCSLSVDIEDKKIVKVRGARCPKGILYAASEIENPTRIFTTTVLAEGLSLKLVPVRTNKPISKKDLYRAMEEVRKVKIIKPTKAGDTIIENFLVSGVSLIATREAV
ncbi:MAG: DUF1667 domain-containing protein [Candidatus Omnitrophica bacterium]|nr:DUF1667 domain-containing protein [Candidatus Omnitrophota bacterium]